MKIINIKLGKVIIMFFEVYTLSYNDDNYTCKVHPPAIKP